MSSIVRKLTHLELAKYCSHLQRLGPDDRYLRFGYAIDDNTIRKYVDGQYRTKQTVLGVFDKDQNVIAAIELVFDTSKYTQTNDIAEIGLSVESTHRGKGLGGELFKQAITIARNRRVTKLISHCLTQNRWMMKIAIKYGMTVVRERSEAIGTLALAPGDIISAMDEMLGDGIALWDYASSQSNMFNPGFIQIVPFINQMAKKCQITSTSSEV